MTTPLIRRATAVDASSIAELLVRDGERRNALDPDLWTSAAGARSRMEGLIRDNLAAIDPSTPQLWLIAEVAGRIVGIVHATLVTVPPIYAVQGSPGLFLDDCFTTDDAPAGTAETLLVAAEDALHAAGASALIASRPAQGPWRPLYESHGYHAVTLYMEKHGFNVQSRPQDVRLARSEDVAGIVSLSADHRHTLAELNPRFWSIHQDADSRFGLWMRHSLTLTDRDILVAGQPGQVDGYVIAQPISPLLVPAVHDISATGVIDDFYDRNFEEVLTITDRGTLAAALLTAAESAFAGRGRRVALAVCPAAWTSKAEVLERAGYRTAKLWMLKR